MSKKQLLENNKISRAEFDKRVEAEYCWLVRWEYMKKGEAWAKATQVIASEYIAE